MLKFIAIMVLLLLIKVRRKNINSKKRIILSIVLITIGIILFLISRIYRIYLENINNQLIEEFLNISNKSNNKQEEIVESFNENNTNKPIFIAVIEIPHISLKRGLFDIQDKRNNVDKNIQVINESQMPNQENGNLILASHSGSSSISFFKNLDQLNINDKIYIYYQGYVYEYVLNNIYDTPKDGNIEIYRDYNKNTITLITCKKNKKDTQVVYIGYLNNKEQYF